MLRRPARGLQDAHDPPSLPVEGDRRSRPGVEYDDAHRRGVDQGLEIGPGLLLTAVPVGVGDDQRRLGGEHDKGLLVLGRERALALSISHEDDADALTQVNDRRHKQGHGTADRQGQFELGQAQGPHVALEVIHSQRLGRLAQVFEQPHALRKVPYPLGLFGSEARRQKVLYLRRIVKEHNDAVQRTRQRAGAVQDAL